jgi:hypothetical protein
MSDNSTEARGAGAAASANSSPCNNYGENSCVIKASPNSSSNNLSVNCSGKVEESKCFKPRASNDVLFDNIKWSEMYKDRNEIFTTFADFLKANSNFKSLLFSIYNEATSYVNFATTVPVVVQLAKESKCQDINMAISIVQPTSTGISNNLKENNRLFHIALHSKFPIYTLGKTRSKDACGLYPKKAGQSESGSGTFHYKIDNLPKSSTKLGIKENRTKEEDAPYKEIKFELKDGVPKIIDDASPFTYPNPALVDRLVNEGASPEAKKEKIEQLHQFIYSKFVEHWNSYPALMSYKKGGRRSRKHRAIRRKTRRAKYI